MLYLPPLDPGLHPSKTKLELQRHLATLDNEEQASVFENTMVMSLSWKVQFYIKESQAACQRERIVS